MLFEYENVLKIKQAQVSDVSKFDIFLKIHAITFSSTLVSFKQLTGTYKMHS